MPAWGTSSLRNGWNWDETNARLDFGYRGTRVGDVDANGLNLILPLLPDSVDAVALGSATLGFADLFLATGGVINWNNGNATITHNAGFLTVNDDVGWRLGTSGDDVFYHRAATLAANTAIASVLAGTPVSAAIPANTLIISNITADGDVVLFTVNAAGANSIEMVRLDASAGAIVLNDGQGDVDVRIESDTFDNFTNWDAGLGAIGIGTAAQGDRPFFIDWPAKTATAATDFYKFMVGGTNAVTIPTGTTSEVASARFTEPNIIATGTVTIAATVIISNAPTEGATNFALYAASGIIGFGIATNANVTASGAVLAAGGLAFTDVANAWIDDATRGTGTTTHYIGNQTITTASDMRLKKDILDYSGDALELLRRAHLVEYAWDDPSERREDGTENPWGRNSRGRFVGFLAQEAIEWAPWTVNAGDGRDCPLCHAGQPCEEHPYWFADYPHMVPLVVGGIQQLDGRLTAVEAEDWLKGRVKDALGDQAFKEWIRGELALA